MATTHKAAPKPSTRAKPPPMANHTFKVKPVPRTKKAAKRDPGKLPEDMRLENRTNIGVLKVADVAAAINPNLELTDKFKSFVKFWAQGESKHSASIRAGYEDSGAYCYRMSRAPQAVALYNEEKRLFEAAAQMTRKQVMDGLLDGIEMAKLAGEPASVITGWKTIGQMCGYFEPRKVSVDVNVTGNATMQQMNKLSDAELLRVIQEGVQNDLERIEHDQDGG